MLSLPNVPGVTHSFIQVNKTKIHVAQAGNGKPLVFLHGWPQHWYVWRKVIPELAKKYLLLMPDLPGFGWSEMPEAKNFRKETLAEDMLQLLDKLNLKQVGLVGHDWGGWVGFLMCLNQPQRFKAYLALGIAHPFQTFDKRVFQFWRLSYQIPIAMPFIGELVLKKNPHFVQSLLIKGTKQPDIWNNEELLSYSSILQNSARAHASSLMYRTFLTKEFIPILEGKYSTRKLAVKTRLLVGDDDPVIYPELIKGFEKYADDMKVEFIKDCGHFIPEEKPETVVKMVKELFR